MTTDTPLREALAALTHEQWSGWMQYLFAQSESHDDGTVTLPAWAVERWTRQMRATYDELPESERESDRVEADRVLAVIRDPRPRSEIAIEKYYRSRVQGSRKTLREIAAETTYSYDYLRKVKRAYDAAGKWGSKKKALLS